MKTKILCGVAVLAIATVSVINVNFNSRSNNLSGIALENAKALALHAESQHICYLEMSYAGNGKVERLTFCSQCLSTLCRSRSYEHFCSDGDGPRVADILQ